MQKGIVHERIKHSSSITIDTLMQELHISSNGYTNHEVHEARQLYGSNDLATRQDSIWHCLRNAFINPFSIILFVLGVISFITDVLLSGTYHKNMTTVIIIFLMLLISGSVRLIQELRSKKVADTLTNLVNTKVQVCRQGSYQSIPASRLVVGDIVKLVAGERVPADIRIVEARDVFVSQSIITGESAILEKNADIIEHPEKLQDFTNIIFSGSTITGGSVTGIVVAVGNESVYGSIDVSSNTNKHGFDKGANSIALVLIRFMVVLVPIVFISSGLTKGDWVEALIFALSIAVGLTPELLPMVVNACLARGSYLMGQKQTIVKNINAMQGFGSMDILCTDKTGTLTGDTVLLEYYMDIFGNECQKTLDYAFLASFYHTGVGNHIDRAICKVHDISSSYYDSLIEQYPKYDEIPFDYSRKYASVLVKDNKHPLIIIKGSIDEVIQKCRYIEYKNEITRIEGDARKQVHAIVDEMLEDGMKVIAVAYKKGTVNEDDDFILLGYLAFFDAPKQSAASAIETLKRQSVNVKVLTGDQALVAKSICTRLHIPEDMIITGTMLDSYTENELPMLVEKRNIFAELTPKQKAMIVEILQENGHTVGFLGDGLNDLPAIIQADVGISVENAIDAVKESADVILLKKDLNVLEEGIIEGRKAFSNMSKYIKITASSNFGNICAIVIASVLLPFFPMTSIQLLLLNLLYDILCLVLPWDSVDEDMLIQPLEWSGKKLGKFMLFFGPLSSIFDVLTFAFLFFVLCPMVCHGSYAILDETSKEIFVSIFQTGWFLESMWTQVLILQLLRTKKVPFIQSKPGTMVVLVTVIGVLLFTLFPLTTFGKLLGLLPLPGLYYVFLVLVVLLYLFLVTIMKYIYIKKVKQLI